MVGCLSALECLGRSRLMTGLETWDGGGDQDRWNPESPYFCPVDHTGPVTKGAGPATALAFCSPARWAVGVRTLTGATIGWTLPSGLCKCPEDRRAIERDLLSAFDVCHVTADSTNEPPSAVLSPLITRHPSPQGRSLIPSVPYLCIPSSVLCSPYDSLIFGDSCLSLPCRRSPSFPCRHPSLRDPTRPAHAATWLTRVPNPSQSQYRSHNYNLAVNNLPVRPRYPAPPA